MTVRRFIDVINTPVSSTDVIHIIGQSMDFFFVPVQNGRFSVINRRRAYSATPS